MPTGGDHILCIYIYITRKKNPIFFPRFTCAAGESWPEVSLRFYISVNCCSLVEFSPIACSTDKKVIIFAMFPRIYSSIYVVGLFDCP